MRRSELRVGATYSDGKKGLRRILDFGPQYTLYDGQEATDCLAYAIVRGARPPNPRGVTAAEEYISHATATSFAAWAKAEAHPPRAGDE